MSDIKTLERPQPKSYDTMTIDEDTLKEYIEAASVLGYKSTEVTGMELLQFLKQNHVPIFDYQEVHEYMKSITPDNKYYVWKNLGQIKSSYVDNDYDDYADRHGQISGTYTKTVPLHILKRAAALKRQDKTLSFYVSDYATPRPDPFLLVKKGKSKFVIGMWDEPAFVGTPGMWDEPAFVGTPEVF